MNEKALYAINQIEKCNAHIKCALLTYKTNRRWLMLVNAVDCSDHEKLLQYYPFTLLNVNKIIRMYDLIQSTLTVCKIDSITSMSLKILIFNTIIHRIERENNIVIFHQMIDNIYDNDQDLSFYIKTYGHVMGILEKILFTIGTWIQYVFVYRAPSVLDQLSFDDKSNPDVIADTLYHDAHTIFNHA
jgi:hypothetical protein